MALFLFHYTWSYYHFSSSSEHPHHFTTLATTPSLLPHLISPTSIATKGIITIFSGGRGMWRLGLGSSITWLRSSIDCWCLMGVYGSDVTMYYGSDEHGLGWRQGDRGDALGWLKTISSGKGSFRRLPCKYWQHWWWGNDCGGWVPRPKRKKGAGSVDRWWWSAYTMMKLS